MKKYQKAINLTLITGLILSPISVFALEKNETIYSNLNNDGTSYKTIVSNHLSWLEEGEIEDNTELKNILNISGLEEYEKKENKLTWNSKGNDIYYQGETEKELPIKTEITYFLNEEEKSVEEILGKAGNIKIQIHFQNQLKNFILINGKNTDLYTPFVTMMGTTLNSKENKNIQINNGKVVGTGSRYMIIGLTSPGLYESLKLKELENLNDITISYETTNFSLNSMYLVSTPKLLESNDLKIFDKMDEFYSNMNELQENMNKLEKGAKELANGANQINHGTSELTNGIKSTLDGINKLQIGANELDNGLNQFIPKLNQIEKIMNNINLTDKIKQLSDLKDGNNTAINSLTNTNNNLSQSFKSQNLDITKQEQALMNDLQNALTTGSIDKTQMNQILMMKKTYDGNKQTINLLNLNNKALIEMKDTLQAIISQLNDLTKKMEQLKAAASGAKQLNKGLNELQIGVQRMYQASEVLIKGSSELNKGANSLSEGATTFNNQGIKKLNNYTISLKSYSDKIEALANLSESYKGFASKNSKNINFVSVIKSAKIKYQR